MGLAEQESDGKVCCFTEERMVYTCKSTFRIPQSKSVSLFVNIKSSDVGTCSQMPEEKAQNSSKGPRKN